MTTRFTIAVGILGIASLTGCTTLPGTARARDDRELNTIRQVALACHMFAVDHDDMLPANTADLAPYLKGDFEMGQVELVASGKWTEIESPSTTVLLRSKAVSSSDKRAVAYVDGHCKLVAEE